MSEAVPRLTVVIPVHNGSAFLQQGLAAMAASGVRPFELIVVDDGSTDDSAAVAERHGARVLRTTKQAGPAHARNLGARSAQGDVLFFLDADVCVHSDTIGLVTDAFSDPSLDALIGSYDDNPAEPDFLSQYKNLMHCFVHHTAQSEACTFWSGCGAIRRDVFFEYSGFDESYNRPAIEDIELGYRLAEAGKRMVLDRNVQVKHLKHWSFWGLLKTDILDRGIPWTELILRDKRMPNDLNIQLSQRVSVALVYVLTLFGMLCSIYWRGYFLTPLFALVFFFLGRYWLDGAAQRSKAVLLAMFGTGLAIVALAWSHHMRAIIPLVVLTFPALLVRHRYELRHGPRATLLKVLTFVYFVVALGIIARYLPRHPLAFPAALILLAVLVLNSQFYIFLAEKRGRWFALAAIPFHLLYHFYNGVSFAVGLARHTWRLAFHRPVVEATSDHGQR
ncbi:glycosyltransferase family A protein [uncultured Paludibaculum sp.]|uniref:glycosyltransferase family 2 protein n=1 Tax=uncultured Paludibaculum sp. TaxID=1765020 RepID=UPI002AAAC91E|nr:glycosyltransferase family A protein [uncultured Paludibaculum sp.]